MDFSGILADIVSFAQGHTLIAVVIGLGLLLFLYRKPKLFLSLIIFGLILAGVLYMINSMAGSGLDYKKKLIHEEERQSEGSP